MPSSRQSTTKTFFNFIYRLLSFIISFRCGSVPKFPIKEKSKLSQKEWVEFTKQIWNIPIPGKGDLAFGEHSAIMPEEIVRRCVRLFTFVGDIVLDPFAGSGTTLKVAKELERNFVGYEISKSYEDIIKLKLGPKLF